MFFFLMVFLTDLANSLSSTTSLFCTAPGIGEGSSTSETPQPPRKKRARVDPTVESVCVGDSLVGFLTENRVVLLRQQCLFCGTAA